MITLLTDLLERPIVNGCLLQDRYRINFFLGKGSYGIAYQALDLMSGQTVVVKQLRKRKSKSRIGLLEREAKLLSSLNHPAIPKCIDLFKEGSKSFLIMEYVEGINVEDLIFHDDCKYNEEESLRILLEVLKVIKYLHEMGIIHRDLRLPNILIKDKKISVIDFGLAIYRHEKEPIPLESMPLEKRLYREISVTSDFYALGHFILFLLYSDYETSTKSKLSWEDELILNKETKRMIRKLLKLENCYDDINDIIEDIKTLLVLL